MRRAAVIVPETNVEIWKRVIRDFNERGVEGALEHFSDEVEVYDPDLPGGRPYRGIEGARTVLEQLTSGFDRMTVQGFELHPVGDRVVGLIHTQAKGRGRLELNIHDAHTFTFGEGKVTYWRLYLDRREALSDAGLDPSLAERAPDTASI